MRIGQRSRKVIALLLTSVNGPKSPVCDSAERRISPEELKEQLEPTITKKLTLVNRINSPQNGCIGQPVVMPGNGGSRCCRKAANHCERLARERTFRRCGSGPFPGDQDQNEDQGGERQEGKQVSV